MKKRRVAIVGLGMITPLGNSVPETWQNLISGNSGIGDLTRFDPDEVDAGPNFPRIAGEVKDFDLTQWGIGKKLTKRADRFTQFALAAGKEALEDSGVDPTEGDPSRIGNQIGTGVGGAETWEEQSRKMLKKGTRRVSPLFIPKLIANMAAANLSINFGIEGPSLSTTTACAAGAHAIAEAFDKIRLGRAEVMVCGGAESCLTPLAFSGFNNMRAMSRRNEEPKEASRPFDKDRDGFVMSEGGGMVVLEELNHALDRGTEIHAELAGAGMSSDAHHITKPNVAGPKSCMESALSEAEIEPRQVGYINSHGTATPKGDLNETKAIKEVFGEEAYDTLISSTKSMTGHLIGAAGGVEAITSILSLTEGIVPPTINLENPDPECDLNYVPNEAANKDIEVALSNSLGFGGTNASLVFKKCT